MQATDNRFGTVNVYTCPTGHRFLPMSPHTRTKRRGYSLLEVAIALVVLSVLSAAAVAAHRHVVGRTHRASIEMSLRSFESEYQSMLRTNPYAPNAEAVATAARDFPAANIIVGARSGDINTTINTTVVKIWGNGEDDDPHVAQHCNTHAISRVCESMTSLDAQPTVESPGTPDSLAPDPIAIYYLDLDTSYHGCLSLGRTGQGRIEVAHLSETDEHAPDYCVYHATLYDGSPI